VLINQICLVHSSLSQPESILVNQSIVDNLRLSTGLDLNADDVFIRKCRLAGNIKDCYGGKFRTDFMPKLLKMTDGIPLLIGHQKDKAPLGRFFGGSVESVKYQDQFADFIVPNFYWPRAVSWGKDMQLLIDSGIYAEASISFSFQKPTCGICSKDIRTCKHLANIQAGEPDAFFYYDQVQGVHEGSIVYKGAEPGTGFLQ
jgi:hypothetical protein